MPFKRLLMGLAALFALASPAFAAPPPVLLGSVSVCNPFYPKQCSQPDVNGAIAITGSVTAGAAFAPAGQATLAVTVASARVALPAASANVTLVNTGAQTAYFLLGNGSVAATTATGYPLQSGSSITLAVGANTNVAAITSTSTTSLSVTSGTGVPALAGGGSTGGGGGGAVTVADGADVTQGALADAACATDNGTCTIAAALKRNNQRLTSILTALGSPFQAGGSIGNTTFASTQGGAWNITNITGTISLPTGASTAAAQGFTAAASGTVVTTAGSSKPAGIDLFGAQGVLLKNADGTALDPTAASATQCGTTTGTMVQCGLDNVNGTTGAAVPSRATYAGANSDGLLTGIVQAVTSAKVSTSTNAITQVVALSSGKKIYVTNFNLHSAGTTTTKWVYGTGTNCGTGTTDLTDLYDFTVSDGMVVGGGLGAVLVTPASQALCISNSASIHVGGSVAYSQF